MRESKIIRSKRERNFTIINNEIFQQGMTLQAIGLLAYLLSRPDDWTIQKKSLSRNFKNGRDGTNTAFNELVEKGYIEVIKNREGGKFKSVDYMVYEEPPEQPRTEKPFTVEENSPQTGKPETVKPYTEKPETENPSLLNTIYNQEGVKQNSSVNSSELTGGLFPDLPSQQTAASKGKEKDSAQKEKPKSIHAQLMDIYWNWYKDLNDGITPNISQADGQAMSGLVKHFKSIATGKGATEETLAEDCSNMLRIIFANWHLLRPFEQSQVSLRHIYSNITNIINQIKNGKKASNTPEGAATRTKQAFDNIDKAFAGK